jgi:exopolysaccharide biosynthesis polyprenyl glycosylphosphotransferase
MQPPRPGFDPTDACQLGADEKRRRWSDVSREGNPVTSPSQFTLLPNRRNGNSRPARTSSAVAFHGMLSQDLFARALFVERKRSERSGRSFVLMVLESARLLNPEAPRKTLDDVLLTLFRSTRDTDTIGWHKEAAAVGILFTELGDDRDPHEVANALRVKVTRELGTVLTVRQVNEIKLSLHVFPENWDKQSIEDEDEDIFDGNLYESAPERKPPDMAKRFMDIAGSLLALIFFLPVFAVIAIAIKLTSKGPVFFSQQRLGRYGKRFNFLKFRSMHVNNDPTIHQEFVKHLIEGAAESGRTAGEQVRYKLTTDPRVTPVGRFLRRTSLDELPQFLNVLVGDMSLVGPRPPIPYEVEVYHVWHRTRLLSVKPGMTGLWQVGGRSRVKFDDMVRMDLQYAASHSLWLDIKILLQTPAAMLSMDGAY